MTDRNGTILNWEATVSRIWVVNMGGGVQNFEIPYVKAYLEKRFHMTAIGWKVNAMPHTDNTMVMAIPSFARGMPSKLSMLSCGMLERNAAVEATAVALSMNDLEKAPEHARQEDEEVPLERQTVRGLG
jgi:hypothetical protein